MARAPRFTLGRSKNVRLTQIRYLFWSTASETLICVLQSSGHPVLLLSA